MKNLIGIALVVFFGFAGIAAADDDHVALFKKVSGNVKIVRGNTELVPAPGTQIMRMDSIVAGPKSSAGVVFVDGTALTIGPSTEIEISRYVFRPEEAKYDFSVYLKKGSAIYSSGKLAKLSPESVSVSTPRATVGVRGTRFIIKESQ